MPEAIIRILLADDHKVLRDGLRVLLEDEGDMEVVGEASTREEAVRLTKEETKMLDLLSERERNVLKLTAMGYTSREIGERLALSPKTVAVPGSDTCYISPARQNLAPLPLVLALAHSQLVQSAWLELLCLFLVKQFYRLFKPSLLEFPEPKIHYRQRGMLR